jgi:hypothetical protein
MRTKDGLAPAVLAGLHWHAWSAVEQPVPAVQVSGAARAGRLMRVPDAVVRSPSAVVSFVDLQLNRAGAVFAVWIPVQVARACGLLPATATDGVWLDIPDRQTFRMRVLMVAAAGHSVQAAARYHTRIEVSVEAVTAAECGGRCIGAEPGASGGERS